MLDALTILAPDCFVRARGHFRDAAAPLGAGVWGRAGCARRGQAEEGDGTACGVVCEQPIGRRAVRLGALSTDHENALRAMGVDNRVVAL